MKDCKSEDEKRKKFEEYVEKNYEVWFKPGWILGQDDGETDTEGKNRGPEDAKPLRSLDSWFRSPSHDVYLMSKFYRSQEN